MKNHIFIVVIILIFMILSSISIANYIVDVNYKRYSNINHEIEGIINDTTDEDMKERLIRVNEEVMFIQEVCFQ